MSKDHFPVNDKSIADVNKANARAYDHVRESSQEHGEQRDASTPTGRYAQTPSHKIGETPKMSIKNEKIAAKIAKGLSKVMQRQEHGEQRDASIQVGPNMGATGKEKEKLMRPSEREKRGIPQEGAEIVIGKKK